MEKIQKALEKYPDKVNRGEYLELAKKDKKGVPRPYPEDNPIHKVKLLRGEFDKRTTQHRGTEQGITLYFEEEGREVKYFVPMLNPETKKFHYLFERFKDIPEKAMLEMECVKKGTRSYIDVREIEEEYHGDSDLSSENIPVVEDENNQGNFESGDDLEIPGEK